MSRSLADLTALKAELTNDPNELGLTLLPEDDAANATKLSEVLEAQQVDRQAIPTIEMARQIDRTEFGNCSEADRAWLVMIMSTGTVNPNQAGQVRQGLLQIFGEQSETRANLLTLLTESACRIEQMFREGLLEVGGTVTPSDVAQARQVV